MSSAAPSTRPKPGTAPAAEVLAAYAATLRYEDLPARAVLQAKICLIDAVACAIHGAQFPWSRALIEVVRGAAGPGACSIPGLDRRIDTCHAALALGACAHAFELDSLRKPGSGVHPGATVALPAFAMAQALSRSGRILIAAIVAGCEVSFRIGNATLHTPEHHGFHASGITGPFAAAVAGGRLIGLSADKLTMALGIAGSCGGGLLAFAKSGQGGMIKRLHLGRAAESGILAARLAARGYEGPVAILDGSFGTLASYCERSDPALLTAGLGEDYEIDRLCLKRYACHVTAQAPVQLLRQMMAEHCFAGADIAAITITASAKVVSHHSSAAPADIGLAQYSVPFSLAIAAFRDPDDPASFAENALTDPAIRDLAARMTVVAGNERGWGAELALTLRDGRIIAGKAESFTGCPETPFSLDDVAHKFRMLTRDARPGRAEALLQRLLDIENARDAAALEF